MDDVMIRDLAQKLYEAEKTLTTIEKFSISHPDITNDEAYRVQLEVLKSKLKDGRTIVGKKIGLTNLAMQKAMGIKEPDYGVLLDDHFLLQDVPVSMATMIQPQIESELAFVLKKDIKGPGVTAAMVMAATEGIIAAFEVVDSRFHDTKIALVDTIADNASCGKIVLGSKIVPIDNLDLRTIGLVLEKNGQVLDLSCSAAVMGSPANTVAWLANKIAPYGIELKAGDVIMSGSFTTVHKIQAGDNFMAHFGGVGTVKMSFVE